jgi:hypothetical protein
MTKTEFDFFCCLIILFYIHVHNVSKTAALFFRLKLFYLKKEVVAFEMLCICV